MEPAGEFHVIFGKRLYSRKGGPVPLKNIEKQTEALLNMFDRVNKVFAIVLVYKSGGQTRFQLSPPGLTQNAASKPGS